VVVGLVHVFEFEALVDFLEWFEDFLPATENGHPDLASQLFVVLENVVLVKDPRRDLILGHKILDNHNSVVKIRV
jgi:hypothetical protein